MRRKPYTKRGISRVPCFRCGAPSTSQWYLSACAKGPGEWVGLCDACDEALNYMVLRFFFAARKARKLITAYKEGR